MNRSSKIFVFAACLLVFLLAGFEEAYAANCVQPCAACESYTSCLGKSESSSGGSSSTESQSCSSSPSAGRSGGKDCCAFNCKNSGGACALGRYQLMDFNWNSEPYKSLLNGRPASSVLGNCALQEQAQAMFAQNEWNKSVKAICEPYLGQTFSCNSRCGTLTTVITAAGCLKAAHLGGKGGLKTTLAGGKVSDSGGGTPCEYLWNGAGADASNITGHTCDGNFDPNLIQEPDPNNPLDQNQQNPIYQGTNNPDKPWCAAYQGSDVNVKSCKDGQVY